MLWKEQFIFVHGIDDHVAICDPKGRFDRIKETGPNAIFDDNPVYDNLNCVLLAFG